MHSELIPFVPPRGSWDSADGVAPGASWMDPAELNGAVWKYAPGKLILGMGEDGQAVAYGDDRHMVTIAGSRAGKTQTVLIPNLRLYPGSAIVIDPKGELAELTAIDRLKMGHRVHILDPFGEVRRIWSCALQSHARAGYWNHLLSSSGIHRTRVWSKTC